MRLRRRRFLKLGLVAAAASALPRGVLALDYPTRPVHLLVGFPPGGILDIVARMIAQELSKRLSQQVIVENRVGAGSNIATELVAKANSDGYTLLLSSAVNSWTPQFMISLISISSAILPQSQASPVAPP